MYLLYKLAVMGTFEKEAVDLVDEEEHLARDNAELKEHVGDQELVLAEILRIQCPSLITI